MDQRNFLRVANTTMLSYKLDALHSTTVFEYLARFSDEDEIFARAYKDLVKERRQLLTALGPGAYLNLLYKSHRLFIAHAGDPRPGLIPPRHLPHTTLGLEFEQFAESVAERNYDLGLLLREEMPCMEEPVSRTTPESTAMLSGLHIDKESN